MVLPVGVEVSAEVVDPLREERDLNRGAPAVLLVHSVLLDNLFLPVLRDRHDRASSGVYAAREASAVRFISLES
jgi:hypothetical protein